MTKYLDFISEITERGDIKKFIESDAGVRQQEGKLMSIFTTWWYFHSSSLGDLPKTKKVMELRAEFINSFIDSLVPVGLLDRFKVAGVVASWWEEVKYELRTLSESGFDGLIDSWVDTIKDALEEDEDDDKKSKPQFDPLTHKLVVRLLSDYLAEIAAAEANIAELEQQKEALERGDDAEAAETEDDEESEDVDASNNFKKLEMQLKHLRSQLKEYKKELKVFKKVPLLVDENDKDKMMELEKNIEINELQIEGIEAVLNPYKAIKKQIMAAKTELRELKNNLVRRLEEERATLTSEECEDLVLTIFQEGLMVELARYVTAHRQMAIAAVENWWDKYQVTLQDIETERDAAAKQLDEFFQGLGYA